MSSPNFTVKFCKKCQCDTDRYGSGECKPCAKARYAVRYAANPERVKASRAAWRAANPELSKKYQDAYRAAHPGRDKAKSAAWLAANPEKARASHAAYRAANPEKIKAQQAAWYAANPERHAETCKAWREANPEVRRIHHHNRRARQRANGGVLSNGLSDKLFTLQNGRCPCCNQPLGADYQLDHVMPIFLGGANTDDNMQLLRKLCNRQKSAAHPVDFMQSRGFLL